MATNNVPLRIFMGLQMIGWAMLIEHANPWSLDRLYDSGWLWSVTIMASGLWLTGTALAEIHVKKQWPKLWSGGQRDKFRILTKCTAAGYFFSGAAWGGIAVHTFHQGEFTAVNILCPLYMIFLFYLAFSDASTKRKGVELNNENKRKMAATPALLRDCNSPARIYTERASR
jgi:hypothetical protein